MRTRIRPIGLTACLLTLASLTACSDSSDTADTADDQSGTRVNMKLIAYKPAVLEVKTQTTVTWSQLDAGVHTVTSGGVLQEAGGVKAQPDGKFDSGNIATGKTYSFTFSEAGTYRYFCTVHPATMRGEVRVT